MTNMQELPQNLYLASQVGELDRSAIERFGIPGETLMERAGRAAFRELRRRWPEARRLVVCCGGGNNGGDGYVVARLARQAGLEVRLLGLREPDALRGSARWAARSWLEAGGGYEGYTSGTKLADARADVIVDAVLGTGLSREVGGDARQLVDAINAAGAAVLAVDIPSGLSGDSGRIMGTAVRADLTVTFIGLKRGLLTGDAPDCTGALRCDDLGIPAAVYDVAEPSARRVGRDDLSRLLPRRPRTAHKGRYGHVLVAGGGPGMPGAVRMAGEAALRIGAGLVSVATAPDHAGSVNVARPELMCHAIRSGADLAPLLERATVIAAGPGLGQSDWARSLFETVLAATQPLVLDADGLNLLAARPRKRERWVLTPHPGEAARLLECGVREVQSDRFAAAIALSRRYEAVVVLKGAGTVVADGERLAVSATGNPGMATGGMGDVLTGVVAGLLAQGLEPFDAARLGAFLHGAAADAAALDGERGLAALDLMPQLRRLSNP
ncbi:MAG TPA: NAD(P)H-hydrate dehydratase [Gammaproteobacteria bacterium]|nr:NAD(P)H-hydrate dehydratase [Gammaproteobacteria bacterium]